MRVSSLLVVVLSLFALPLTGCGTPERDYQVAVTWVINGMTPSAEVCAEQGIARARFEVWNERGKKLQTLESSCSDTIFLSDGNEYGGFVTTRAFEWDRGYDFTLTLVAANGSAVSTAAEGSFYLDYGEADVYELGYLDYVQPTGNAASLTGEWQLYDRNGQPTTCVDKGIAKIQIIAASLLDQELVDSFIVGEMPCAGESVGTFQSAGNILATGNYQFLFQAVSAANVTVAESTPVALYVAGGPAVISPRQTLQIR